MTPDRRRTRSAAALALGLGVVAWSAATGQQESRPLVGDRPDFTESSETVERGRFQLETGATRAGFAGDGEETAVGEVLVRIGLAARWELRLGAGSWVDTAGGADGFDDASVGFKVKLADAAGSRPDLALLFGATLPTGSSEQTADEAVPEVRLAAAWTPARRLGIGANLGWARAIDAGERYDELSWSVAAGLALAADWGAFLELYGYSREELGGDPTVTVDFGVTRLLHQHLQLDARLGFALDDGGGAAAEWFAGVGAVVLW